MHQAKQCSGSDIHTINVSEGFSGQEASLAPVSECLLVPELYQQQTFQFTQNELSLCVPDVNQNIVRKIHGPFCKIYPQYKLKHQCSFPLSKLFFSVEKSIIILKKKILTSIFKSTSGGDCACYQIRGHIFHFLGDLKQQATSSFSSAHLNCPSDHLLSDTLQYKLFCCTSPGLPGERKILPISCQIEAQC